MPSKAGDKHLDIACFQRLEIIGDKKGQKTLPETYDQAGSRLREILGKLGPQSGEHQRIALVDKEGGSLHPRSRKARDVHKAPTHVAGPSHVH